MLNQDSPSFEELLAQSRAEMTRHQFARINRRFGRANVLLWIGGLLISVAIITVVQKLPDGDLSWWFSHKEMVEAYTAGMLLGFPILNALLSAGVAAILGIVPYPRTWAYLDRCARIFWINLTIGHSIMVLSMVFLLGTELL